MGDFAGIERAVIGSSDNPFGMTPNSGHFYSNPIHEEVCNTIVTGIRKRRGLIVLTGEPGTGKTTIVQQAIDRLDKGSCSVLFCSFHPALDQTVNSLCEHLGLDISKQEQQRKVQQLNQALLARFWSGKSTAFVVDDAHTLDARTLVQILSLVDLTLTGEHLLQVVLVGWPELTAKLHSAFCRPLLPTGFPSSEVPALPPAEVAPFIEHQLRAVPDAPQRFFTPEAMHLIAVYSKGLPREIHTLCGLAWVIADLESSLTITAEMVEEIKGERALWGVGVDAETAASAPRTPKTDTTPISAMPRTPVDPPSDASRQQAGAGDGSNADDTGKDQDAELSPTLVVNQPVAPLEDAPPSTITPIGADERPKKRRFVAQGGWWPSRWLMVSALGFSVFVVTVVLLWYQFSFSGDSARPDATNQANTSSPPKSPKAEAEFAQMRPAITQATPEPVPRTQEASATRAYQRTFDASRAASSSASPSSSPQSVASSPAESAQGEPVYDPLSNAALSEGAPDATTTMATLDGSEDLASTTKPAVQDDEHQAVGALPPPPSEPVAQAHSKHVARAQFTNGIEAREPIDRVGPVVYSNGKHLRRLYFFTEIKGLAGENITHRWEHEGETIAEVSFPIGGNRWRVYSSKRLIPPMAGDWSVVVSSAGEALYVNHFTYVLGTGPISATD